MSEHRAYQPIACDFHDQLEAFATTRKRVRLALKSDPPNPASQAVGRIADLYTTGSKEEFLRLEDGTEIRLDRILSIDDAQSIPL